MLTIDPVSAENSFREKLREYGLVPPDHLDGSGKLTRIDLGGKKAGNKYGFYVWHSDGIPSGAYGHWATDKSDWQTYCAVDLKEISAAEYAEHQRRLNTARIARESEARMVREHAAAKADEIWGESTPCTEHPYLTRKQVKPYGVRVYHGRLVVPLRDAEGKIHSLEFIDDAGAKMFLAGARKAGCWCMLGEPAEVICIAEGYATAASVHEAIGHAVAVAFDCGNLLPVARALREKCPTAKIVVCADDDIATKGNPGLTAAEKAAKEVGGVVAVPEFLKRPDGASDFNDMRVSEGVASVMDCINAVLSLDDGPIDAEDLFPMVMQEILDRKSGKSKSTLSFGIGSVDRLTNKMRRGYVTIMAGLPGAGKTSAALGTLVYNAQHDIPCMFFSLEMDRIDIGIRCLSQNSGVPAVHLFSDEIKEDDERLRWSDVMSANGRMEKILLTLDDRMVSISQLEEQAHKWFHKKVKAAGKATGLIAIDYLGLIRSDETSQNRNREVASFCHKVKQLAKDLKVPVMLLAQLNREAARRGGEPESSDLRDSGEIEAMADLIIFPYLQPRDDNGDLAPINADATADEVKNHVDKWIVRKNRNGAKGAAQVKWNAEIMQYTGLESRFDGQPDTRGDWQNGRGNE
jgi:putative DNA primase/helicase